MPRELDDWHDRQGGYVSRPRFDDYAEKYSAYFQMRRENGILEVRMHSNDGPARFGFDVHNAWGQAWQVIGNDPDNEVLIITGTGDDWLSMPTPDAARDSVQTAIEEQRPRDFAYEHTYYDAVKLLENFVFAVDIPTIAAINGPSLAHTEFALLCDITLAAESAMIMDPHYMAGTVPGDGLQLTLQELLGTKRAAYYLYTGKPIDAIEALRLGLVNEILAGDELLTRAWELAREILRAPRTTRRLTHAVIQRPWKRRLVDDLASGVAHEMFAISAER